MMKALGPALVLGTLLSGEAAWGQPGDGCSHDVLHIAGTPVNVVLCVSPEGQRRKGAGRAVNVGIVETLSANGNSFSRTVPLEFMDGGEASRTIDDVSLHPLGIDKSLHLTMRYRPGLVRLEHAMLVPDAISLK
jgi:hypothetical protein